MSPYVNQVLNKGEIKLPVLLEGENFSQVPPAHDVFRPLRQNIYAVLFNLHHARFTKKSNDEAGGQATDAISIPAIRNLTHYSYSTFLHIPRSLSENGSTFGLGWPKWLKSLRK